MVRRGGHRVVSAATKAKIAASLRGNKNAFRGGPRQRLNSRQKVANINAHTKANRLNLSDAQLKQRAAVAKRLRARARAEEAGIKPDHAKPIPTPATIEKRDVEVRENVARAKQSVPKLEQKKTRTAPRRDPEAARAAVARQNRDMANTKEARRRVERARQNGTVTTVAKEKAGLERTQARNATKRVAQNNTGKGNFSHKETKIAARIASGKQKYTQGVLNDQERAQVRKLQASGDHDKASAVARKALNASKQRIEKTVAANRTASSKDKDPRVSNARSLSNVNPETVHHAYKSLAAEQGDFVRLSKVRDKVGGSKEEFDSVLHHMTRSGMVHLAQSANLKALTKEDHVSGIRIGSETKHLIAIEDVYQPRPL